MNTEIEKRVPDKIYLVESTRVIDEWRRAPSKCARNYEFISKDTLVNFINEEISHYENLRMKYADGDAAIAFAGTIGAFRAVLQKINSL